MLVLPQICYVVEGDLECLIVLPIPQILGLVIYRHIRFCVMQGVGAQGFMLFRQVL